MDGYCIQDGFLVDNPEVVSLEGPDVHSVHWYVPVFCTKHRTVV